MVRHRFRPSALGADRTFAGLDLRGQYTASGASTQQSRTRKPAVKAAIYHEQFRAASASERRDQLPLSTTEKRTPQTMDYRWVARHFVCFVFSIPRARRRSPGPSLLRIAGTCVPGGDEQTVAAGLRAFPKVVACPRLSRLSRLSRTFAGLDLRGQYTASGASTQQSRRRKPAVKAAIHHEQFRAASASERPWAAAHPRRWQPVGFRPRAHAPWSLPGFVLSLAFQAQLLAHARPRHARIRAANASERPWPVEHNGLSHRRVHPRLDACLRPRLCLASLGGPCMTQAPVAWPATDPNQPRRC